MTFAKIIRIGLALPHFSCILYFFWKSSHHGEILDLLPKMLSKPRSYKCFVFGLSIHLTFSTVFSTLKPIFLHDDLISSKKSIYMKNAEERARFEIFCRKSWTLCSPCQNRQKPPENMQNIYCVVY